LVAASAALARHATAIAEVSAWREMQVMFRMVTFRGVNPERQPTLLCRRETCRNRRRTTRFP
jgi:hypothetical protein